MGKHAQLVMGPAGSGKSTYVNAIQLHCENSKRIVHFVNLDPAAEVFNYPISIDIKDLITVDEVMEELSYGPNGGLVYALEHLMENIEWFGDQLGEFEDDYLLIDCPGQIELYSHLDTMQTLVSNLQKWGYIVCGVYLIDSTFLKDSSKFISGALMALSAMVRFEMPHINVLTKIDLLEKKEQHEDEMEKYVTPDIPSLISDLNKSSSGQFQKLNEAIGTLLEDYSMVAFVPLNIKDEESVTSLLLQIDNAIQYGEDLEIREPIEEDEEIDDVDYPAFNQEI